MMPGHSIELPDAIPVMILPECTLFPNCLLPLFIFEPRYRAMLAHALEHERFFCIANSRPGVDPETHPDPVFPITTAGLVRACVTHENGTSHLMLLGTERIRLKGWLQEAPFRIAEIQPLVSENADHPTATELIPDVIDLTEILTEDNEPMSARIQEHLRTMSNPSIIADVVAHNFVTDPGERRTLLETLDVTERLHLLIQHLQRRITDEG